MPRDISWLYWRSESEFRNGVDELLSEGFGLNELGEENEKGETLLHLASHKGYTNIAINLLDRGADIHLKDKNGNTALHHAARSGRTEVVRLLIDRGASFEVFNFVLETPTHLAIWNHHIETTDVFLQKGNFNFNKII